MKERNKAFIGVLIFIICLIGLMQGISIWFTEPDYTAYCSTPLSEKKSTSLGCIPSAEIALKEKSCDNIYGLFVYEYDSSGCVIDGNCDSCRIAYEREVDSYTQSVFIVCLIVGIVMLLAGLILFKIKPFGIALIGSGVVVEFYGVVKNWRNFDLAWKGIFIFILIVLIVYWTLYIKNRGKRIHYVKKNKSLFLS